MIDINVDVFPNPSLGEINIETDLCVEKINVYQQDGRLLKTLHDNKFRLDKNAIYFLKIFTESGNIVKKVIVQ